ARERSTGRWIPDRTDRYRLHERSETDDIHVSRLCATANGNLNRSVERCADGANPDGLVLNAAFGWKWADPVAALAMTPIIIREGRSGLPTRDKFSEERCSQMCPNE